MEDGMVVIEAMQTAERDGVAHLATCVPCSRQWITHADYYGGGECCGGCGSDDVIVFKLTSKRREIEARERTKAARAEARMIRAEARR